MLAGATAKRVNNLSWLLYKTAQTNTTNIKVWGHMHPVACSLAKRPDIPMTLYSSTAASGGAGLFNKLLANAHEDATLATLCARTTAKSLLNGADLANVHLVVMHH